MTRVNVKGLPAFEANGKWAKTCSKCGQTYYTASHLRGGLIEYFELAKTKESFNSFCRKCSTARKLESKNRLVKERKHWRS